ncbi:MAG TPA: energy transducer TonB [Candidatus Krumholzibacteria bacterium]|nr:energy transducer TonB [Candidatus Krumholzibacteria bacterium]
MVTDARIFTHRRDKTLLWGLVVSIALHALFFMPGIRDVFKNAVKLNQALEAPPPDVPMEFTIVSPPENPVPPEKDQESRFRSTVNAQASDNEKQDTGADAPHSTGKFPIPDTPGKRDGNDGGGQSEVPPMPQEQEGLGEAIARSKWTPQVSPQQEPSFADESVDFDEPGSARASIGGISLSTTNWDFAPYLLDLKRRIKQKWIPPIAFTALGAIHGYTWVRFRIYPDGHMEDMQVIETEGHDSLHRASANAVKSAAPFRELPKDFPDPYLEIEFGFYYLLPGDEDRYFKNGRFVRKDEQQQKEQP